MSDEQPKIINFLLRVPKQLGLTFHMGPNILTGPPLVGDTIEHLETKRKFKVVNRAWQAGEGREHNLAIDLEEILMPEEGKATQSLPEAPEA